MRNRFSKPVIAILGVALCTAAYAGPAEDAERAYRDGDVVAAMALLRRAAEAGSAPAQSRLAAILDAAEDDRMAFELYRKSAAQGDAAGEYGLATMHAKGEGTARDPAEALKWYRAAADHGHALAAQAIAWAYLVGDLGLAPSPEQAQAWGERAVKLGGARPVLAASPKPESRK
jgi:TPR repeat protein